MKMIDAIDYLKREYPNKEVIGGEMFIEFKTNKGPEGPVFSRGLIRNRDGKFFKQALGFQDYEYPYFVEI